MGERYCVVVALVVVVVDGLDEDDDGEDEVGEDSVAVEVFGVANVSFDVLAIGNM